MGAQGTAKNPTSIPREPKGGQGHPKESKMSLKTFKDSNKSQNYIHINTIYANSDPPSYSGRLVPI